MTTYDPPGQGHQEAEVALLAACLRSKNARIASKRVITPADFYQPAHGEVYAAMLALDRAGKTVDQVTITAALPNARPDQLAALLLAVYTDPAVPEGAADYAAIVRRWATKRRLADEGRRLTQQAESPSVAPDRLASEAVTRLTAIRDHGTQDVVAMTLGEVMEQVDADPRWVVPDLLEARDRVILTGSEGAGKSVLSRQISICGAAGVHPFTCGVMPPLRALIVDCENKPGQIKRSVTPLLRWLREHGQTTTNPMDRVLIDTPGRINILQDRALSRIHQALDALQPDLVIMGPIYRMVPRGMNTDEEAAEFLSVVDTITERGCAVILEAHAGHAQDESGKRKTRSLRPRGSSALMGWPEFGLGLRGAGNGLADLEPWRGGREQRAWPGRVRRSPGNRWLETAPDDRGTDYRDPPPEDPPPATDGLWNDGI